MAATLSLALALAIASRLSARRSSASAIISALLPTDAGSEGDPQAVAPKGATIASRTAARRTIRVVWFGAEEVGGPGGRDYARRHGGERHALAAESDFGADRVWRFETALLDSAAAVGARLGSALAPLGIVRGNGVAGDGADIAPIIRTGVAGVDLNQSGLDYFDVHHTADDVLDRVEPEALRQNVAAWTAMLAIVANAPEAIGPVVRPK